MTQQIKIPLLPLPPVEGRTIEVINAIVKVDDDNPAFALISWTKHNYTWEVDAPGYVPLNMNDHEILGIIPPFTVVDGQIVFEVG